MSSHMFFLIINLMFPTAFLTDCGRPAIEPLLDDEFRIFGGKEARPHSWPWQAYITICQIGGCQMCGGNLITNNKVLTAAHCTSYGRFPASYFKIRLGTHNFRKPVGSENGDLEVGVKSYATKSTNSNSFDNDLAILTLDKPVPYNVTISPVCLAQNDPAAGTSCYGTGWGYTETGWTDVLKQVVLPISNDTVCLKEVNGPIDNKLCAGAEAGKDTCQGDSGGPLVCFMDNVWQLVGTTSYGNADCGTVGRPGVYAKISSQRDWILNN